MPRYEIRNTSDNSLTYVEGTLPVDLMLTQAAGTYRAKVMSAEEATDIVVPTLTAGTIVQTTPDIGDTLTVTGSNAPSGATFLWEVDTGGGFGAAGGTNNAASYDTTGQPAGDYRRGVSTAGQSMVYTPAVAASVGFTLLTQDRDTSTADTTRDVSVTATAGQTVVLCFYWSSSASLSGVTVDPGGPDEIAATSRVNIGTSQGVALFDVVWPTTGALTVRATMSSGTNTISLTALSAGTRTFQNSVSGTLAGTNPQTDSRSITTTAGQSAIYGVTITTGDAVTLTAGVNAAVGSIQDLAGSGRWGVTTKNDSVSGGSPQTFSLSWPTASFRSGAAFVGIYG